MNKKVKKALKIVLIALVAVLLVVIGYVSYVFLSYNRIEDKVELTATGTATNNEAKLDTTYTIVTNNVGFGAYTADFTFFMDGGSESRAASKESVEDCTDAAVEMAKSFSPDIILFQEVDTDSTRSYHVNQSERMAEQLEGYDQLFAVNYHSAYLFYPVLEPHGKSNSGIATFSNMTITSGLRRQLPVSTGFSKILDLDRCYSISRINVENGKELVVFNTHLSAYGSSGDLKAEQLKMLFSDMKKEYDSGNYVICGGDFNADFTGTSASELNAEGYEERSWAQPLDDALIPEGIIKCTNYDNTETIATVRDCDVAYGPDNFVAIVDGFLVSDNIEVKHLENVWAGFEYSDHNPVYMQFELK